MSLRRSTMSFSGSGKSKSMWNLAFEDRRLSSSGFDRTKLTQLLKTTQLEQLSKLQSKHQQECDLLDDIRNFGKQRSSLDKEYGQALQRLAQQFQRKELSNTQDADDTDQKTVMSVWKSLLDATEKAAQARIVASENYKNNISEVAKNCRNQKDIQLKKCQDLLNTLQNEITETVKDLTKAKKKYYELEQLSGGAREKFQDVTERLKKNRTGIFKNKAGLEKTVQKLEQRCEETGQNSTVARNEYILTLRSANAHQRRYYEVDMPEAMRLLDGDLYTKLQEYLAALSRIELDAANSCQEAYGLSAHHATKITREYNIRCFLRENQVFEWGPCYDFEPCGDDPNAGKLEFERPEEDNSLNREARKWANFSVRDNMKLQRNRKLKHELEKLTEKYAENPDLATEAAAQEAEVRLEKSREDVRKYETSHLQAEARLQVLRESSVDVDTWLASAKAQAAKDASVSHANMVRRQSMHNRSHNKAQRQNSVQNNSPDANGDQSAAATLSNDDEEHDFFDDEFYEDETFDEDAGAFDRDNLSLPSSDHSRVYPLTCTVRYAYGATREDELTIDVGDVIEAVEDGDLDQWVKARNKQGRVGYVPENYIEFPASVSTTPSHQYALPPTEEEVSALESVSSSSSTSGTSSMTSGSSGNDREVVQINSGHHAVARSGICLAKAIYDYEGCSSDELSFPENAIINILSKDLHGVDDGFWKGELNGRIGVFPGIVVEEITCPTTVNQNLKVESGHSPSISPLFDRPPSFQPPPPNECPPPPPVGGDRNPSPDSGVVQNELVVPEVGHQRTYSAPPSPIYSQVQPKPNRSAPPPPKRPASFLHANRGTT